MTDKEKMNLYNKMASQRDNLIKKIIATVDEDKKSPSLSVTEILGVLEAVKIFLINRVKHFKDFPLEGDYILEDFKKRD